MKQLQSFLNALERIRDIRALNKPIERVIESALNKQRCTGGQAAHRMIQTVKTLDPMPGLKRLYSEGSLDAAGTTAIWCAHYNLPNRRAKIIITWNGALQDVSLISDGLEHARASETIRVQPYPLPESEIRNRIRSGKESYSELYSLWEQEHHKDPTLPIFFKDTDSAINELITLGLDVQRDDWTLSAVMGEDQRHYWQAVGTDFVLKTPFGI